VKEKKQVDVGNAEVVPRDDYVQTLEEIVAGGFCPFCEVHLLKHHRKPILYRTAHWLVTENSWPYEGTEFHILFIAIRHIERVRDLSPMEWLDLKDLHRRFEEESGIKGSTFFIRQGDTSITGASVNHLHAHLVVGAPRTAHSKPIKALVGFKK
jgi:diadenosine tetraphosphate (Ap4A) HIT family hydrolase